jgi:hypothetical protein
MARKYDAIARNYFARIQQGYIANQNLSDINDSFHPVANYLDSPLIFLLAEFPKLDLFLPIIQRTDQNLSIKSSKETFAGKTKPHAYNENNCNNNCQPLDPINRRFGGISIWAKILEDSECK